MSKKSIEHSTRSNSHTADGGELMVCLTSAVARELFLVWGAQLTFKLVWFGEFDTHLICSLYCYMCYIHDVFLHLHLNQSAYRYAYLVWYFVKPRFLRRKSWHVWNWDWVNVSVPSPFCNNSIWCSTMCLLSSRKQTSEKTSLLKPQSHIHDSRPAHQKFIHFFQCVVMHSLLVRRARWANGIVRRHALRASTIFVHAQKCALSSTHKGGRQTHAECAGPAAAPDTRGTRAGYSLYARRLMRREHPACGTSPFFHRD